MNVSLARGAVHGWPGWWIRRGPLELGMVPEIGGRLMSLRWRAHELSFVHPAHAGRRVPVDTADDVAACKRAMGFVHWGGDKTWLAPQERWRDALPFLDLDSGAYSFDVERDDAAEVRVVMRSPVCRETGARIVRAIVVCADVDDFTVTHVLENASGNRIAWGLWDVHQVGGPGIAYVPRRAGSPFRDGVKAYPAEGDSEGARADVVRIMDGVAAIDCRRQRWFKFGVDATEGWALGIVERAGRLVGYVKEVPVAPGAVHAHDAVLEVYNSPTHPYFELEAHGPFDTLEPGERTTLVDRRRVLDVAAWPACEADVRALASTRR
jgi:hypothetical protein